VKEEDYTDKGLNDLESEAAKVNRADP